jgi:hypothetical protein
MCLRIFDQVVVVLSSSSAIKDLLGRRGEVYSDRPVFRLHQVYAQSKHCLFSLIFKTSGWERSGSCRLFARVKPGSRAESYWIAAFGLVLQPHIEG